MKTKLLTTVFSIFVFYAIQAQNPFVKHIFTADPSPLVYKDTLYVYTGHDTASVKAPNYEMADWHVFSTTDMVNWKDYGAVLKPKTFSWAEKDAYASECVQYNGKFYWFVAVGHRSNADSKGGLAIGVAVADNPYGPFRDAIGKALIVNEMTTDMKYSWDDMDPTVLIDDDGQAYLYWGNGSCKFVKLKKNLTEIDGSITTFKPRNYTEGPLLYKRNNLYYLVYAANFPETIEYCTATSPVGPWTYRGVIQDRVVNSTTTQAGIVDYKGKSYFFYHNGALPTGGNYRRSVCVDYMYYNPDGTIQKVVQTTKGVDPVK